METTPICAHSLKELALAYGVGRNVIRTWLQPFAQEIGPRQGRFYTVRQVKIIFERLGPPNTTLIERRGIV